MTNLYPFLAYVFVTTFTPGPNNIMAMSNAMRYGYRRILGFLAGVCAGVCTLMLICGLSNAALVRLVPEARQWLGILGAVYMVGLAIYVMLSKPHTDSSRSQTRDLNTFTAGFALQFLNVKAILFGVTVFSTFITRYYQSPAQISIFALFLGVLAFVGTSSWAIGGQMFRRFLHGHERLLNLAMGALLIYAAASSVMAGGS